MKKLKAAIVGCGRISVSYADAFHRLSDEVELVYAVDKICKSQILDYPFKLNRL